MCYKLHFPAVSEAYKYMAKDHIATPTCSQTVVNYYLINHYACFLRTFVLVIYYKALFCVRSCQDLVYAHDMLGYCFANLNKILAATVNSLFPGSDLCLLLDYH